MICKGGSFCRNLRERMRELRGGFLTEALKTVYPRPAEPELLDEQRLATSPVTRDPPTHEASAGEAWLTSPP
jgi:hypothetical protein